MKSQNSKVMRVCLFGLFILNLCYSCEDLPIRFTATDCVDNINTSPTDGVEVIEKDMQISGAWFLTVFKHRLRCDSDLIPLNPQYRYDELRSAIFFLETSAGKLFYIEKDDSQDLEMTERQIVGEWRVGEPLIVTLPLKNDDPADTVQTSHLKLYVDLITEESNAENTIASLQGYAHYENDNQTVMVGNFKLRRVD